MATEVHHRKPMSEGGGKYDWDNLESVCGDCQDEAHGANRRSGSIHAPVCLCRGRITRGAKK